MLLPALCANSKAPACKGSSTYQDRGHSIHSHPDCGCVSASCRDKSSQQRYYSLMAFHTSNLILLTAWPTSSVPQHPLLIGHCFGQCLLECHLAAYNTALKMRFVTLHMGWDKACRSRDTTSTVLCGPYQLDSMHTRFSHINAATHQSCTQELTLLQFAVVLSYVLSCVFVEQHEINTLLQAQLLCVSNSV